MDHDRILNGTQDVIGALMSHLRVDMDNARANKDIVTLCALHKIYMDCQLIMGNMLARIYKPILAKEQIKYLNDLIAVTNSIKHRTKTIASLSDDIKNVAEWIGAAATVLGKIIVFLV